SPEALLVIDTQASMVKLPLMSSDALSGTLIQPLTGPESTYQASNGCAPAAVAPSKASAAKATNDRARRAARKGWRDMGRSSLDVTQISGGLLTFILGERRTAVDGLTP